MEGDIIMTPEEIAAIEHGQDPTTVRQNRKRKLTRWTDYRWPGGIVPYTVNQSLSEYRKLHFFLLNPYTPKFKKYLLPPFKREMCKWGSENW